MARRTPNRACRLREPFALAGDTRPAQVAETSAEDQEPLRPHIVACQGVKVSWQPTSPMVPHTMFLRAALRREELSTFSDSNRDP